MESMRNTAMGRVNMVDFHTHILPGIDDGSRSVEESLAMVQEEIRQQVDTILLTPHFYAHENSPQQFLQRRDAAWNRLSEKLPQAAPDMYLGAEVQYFEGICRIEDLELLHLGGGRILLLEMPFARWSQRVLHDVAELQRREGTVVLLAHIERYLNFQPAEVWEDLLYQGVLMQSNASFFLNWKTRRQALRMLQEGKIHVLGSDCHNMSSRPPRLGEAMDWITGKADRSLKARMRAQEEKLIGMIAE